MSISGVPSVRSTDPYFEEVGDVGDDRNRPPQRVSCGLLQVYGSGSTPPSRWSLPATTRKRIRTEATWAHLRGVAPIPASSGKIIRHRLNRDGNRLANSALYHIALTRMHHDQTTRDHVARRLAEGKTMGEIARILKRYADRKVFKHLQRPEGAPPVGVWPDRTGSAL